MASKLTGTILQVRVHAGDRVKAGQLLATIDSREAEAMIQKARWKTRSGNGAAGDRESYCCRPIEPGADGGHAEDDMRSCETRSL